MDPEEMKFVLRALVIFAPFFVTSGAMAQDTIDDLPANCNNNDGIYRNPEGKFFVGPLWLRRCDNVCEFDSSGAVARHKTVWHLPTVCAGSGGSVITWLRCQKDIKNAGCFEVVRNSSDPRNHDCRSNGDDWQCGGVRRTITCPNLERDGKKPFYKRVVETAECVTTWAGK